MFTTELFMDGITGRYFKANRNQLIKLLDQLVGKSTMGGVAMAISALTGIYFPSSMTVDFLNMYGVLDKYDLVPSETKNPKYTLCVFTNKDEE